MYRASTLARLCRRPPVVGVFAAAMVLAACAAEQREPTAARPEVQEPIRAAELPQERPAATQPVRLAQVPEAQVAGAQVSGREENQFAFPTGEAASSAILLERITPDEVRVNRPYQYEIRVTNLTDESLSNVVVREQIPESLQITEAQPTTRPAEGGYHEYVVGDLGPRESRTITVSGIPQQEGPIDACMTVSYTPLLCVTTQVINPILELSLAGPQQALLCDQLVYRYTIRNVGTGTERNVRIVDQLPEGLTTLDGQNQVIVEFGDVPAGESREQTVALRAQRTGQFTRQVIAQTEAGDQLKSQEVVTVVQVPNLDVSIQGPEVAYIGRPVTYQVTVTNTGDAPARSLAMDIDAPAQAEVAAIIDGQPKLLTVQPEPRRPEVEERPRLEEPLRPRARDRAQEGVGGGILPTPQNGVYRTAPSPGTPEVELIPEPREQEQIEREEQPLRLRTEGEEPIGEARVGAIGPGGEIDLAQQGIGPLAPGESMTFNVTVPDPQAGPLQVTAAANAYCAEPASATATTNIEALSALLLAVVDQEDPIQVGNNVAYTVTVRNQGSGVAQNVLVIGTLPNEIAFIRATGPNQPQVEGQKLVFPAFDLPAGQTVTWQVLGRAQAPGDVRFRVELNARTLTAGPATSEEPTRLY